MKKIVIFLLCIALIFSLVSCDVSSFWSEIWGTTTTTHPEYKGIKFAELAQIDTNEIEKITYTVDYYLSSHVPTKKELPMDWFFNTFVAKNQDIEMISEPSSFELYNAKMDEAHDSAADSVKEYVSINIATHNNDLIIITIYPNNAIGYIDFRSNIHYISLGHSNISVEELIDMYTAED